MHYKSTCSRPAKRKETDKRRKETGKMEVDCMRDEDDEKGAVCIQLKRQYL